VKHQMPPRQGNQLAHSLNTVPRVNILGVGVTPSNFPEVIATLRKWREEDRREFVCCAAVHSLVEAQRDPEVRSALNRAGLTTTDGMPLLWWCRLSLSRSIQQLAGLEILRSGLVSLARLRTTARSVQCGRGHLDTVEPERNSDNAPRPGAAIPQRQRMCCARPASTWPRRSKPGISAPSP
jgi:hypothetical protein